MSETLTVSARDKVGTRNNHKLRVSGHVPAVLYGHNEASVHLSVPLKQLEKALSQKAKVVSLDGAETGQAVVQALQWDTFHRDLLHLDLLRVRAGEKVTVTIPIEIKGEAPGSAEGGMIEKVMMQVEIEAAPASIPEVLHVDISKLALGDAVHASEIIDLPAGATLLTDPTAVLVHCVPPAGAPALGDSVGDADEPEVIDKASAGE
ncbi:50S ribosomal protein L25 [Botrimarina hoheduenensis]|uniref:Large ribosomal subunit protein bL25 n=1 Tax=Botrimarina hoheduenensis TaxID=2528000 RepID=A0A5C5WC58_9BACT|nr:50S ribosomal protein L25 [Botrimarina hoheduenensis]TWT47669.1 50S ribosomal protein L25 [Botrimarina hoheduenensis]